MVLLAWPEVWVLASWNEWGEQATDGIYNRAIGFLWVQKNTFQAHQNPCNLPETNGDFPWGPQCPLVYHLHGWYSHLLQGSGQPPWEAWGCVLEIGGGRTNLKPSKRQIFWWQLAYLGHVISTQGVATDEGKIEAIKNWPTPTNVMVVQSLLGFHGILLLIHPQIHAGGMTSAWINIRWKYQQEEGCH